MGVIQFSNTYIYNIPTYCFSIVVFARLRTRSLITHQPISAYVIIYYYFYSFLLRWRKTNFNMHTMYNISDVARHAHFLYTVTLQFYKPSSPGSITLRPVEIALRRNFSNVFRRFFLSFIALWKSAKNDHFKAPFRLGFRSL